MSSSVHKSRCKGVTYTERYDLAPKIYDFAAYYVKDIQYNRRLTWNSPKGLVVVIVSGMKLYCNGSLDT